MFSSFHLVNNLLNIIPGKISSYAVVDVSEEKAWRRRIGYIKIQQMNTWALSRPVQKALHQAEFDLVLEKYIPKAIPDPPVFTRSHNVGTTALDAPWIISFPLYKTQPPAIDWTSVALLPPSQHYLACIWWPQYCHHIHMQPRPQAFSFASKWRKGLV